MIGQKIDWPLQTASINFVSPIWRDRIMLFIKRVLQKYLDLEQNGETYLAPRDEIMRTACDQFF